MQHSLLCSQLKAVHEDSAQAVGLSGEQDTGLVSPTALQPGQAGVYYTGHSLSLTKSWWEVGGPGWGDLWGVLAVPKNNHAEPPLLRHLLCKERRSKLTWEEY